MNIYLIRHSKPDVPEGTFYGQSDVDVTKAEFEQTVARIREKMDLTEIKTIYTSPLKRCSLLAHALQPDHSTIYTDNRIMELDFGAWELQKWDNIDPKALGQWINDFVYAPTPGGESHMDLYKRVAGFWDETIQNSNGPMAVVTHGGVIKSIFSRILETPLNKSYSIKVHYGELISTQYFGENQYEIEFLTSPE